MPALDIRNLNTILITRFIDLGTPFLGAQATHRILSQSYSTQFEFDKRLPVCYEMWVVL